MTNSANASEDLEKYIAFHQERLELNLNNLNLKFYVIPFADQVSHLTLEHFKKEFQLYKEDYGLFLITLEVFRKFSCSTPEEADYLVFPLNLLTHPSVPEEMLNEEITKLRSLQHSFKKEVIFFSYSDFCMKPYRRSTPFERVLRADFIVKNDDLNYPKWIEPNDILLCFESSLDNYFTDLTIFPLPMADATSPFQNSNKYLFGFVGEYHKEFWPEGFVRSPSKKGIWENLKSHERACIMSTAEAKQKYSQPFYESPRDCTFTLCPRGISNWSFRVFEAILGGSIPVMISDTYVKPFNEYLNWDHFSINVAESELPNIDKFLSRISNENIDRLKENLLNNQRFFNVNGLFGLIFKKLSDRKLGTKF